MTSAIGSVNANAVPRVYGASELGVLAITAPDDAHPRVEYVGGELFVGLGDAQDGSAVTRGQAEVLSQPFAEVVAGAVSSAGALPEPVDGLIIVDDEVLACAILLDPSRAAATALDGAAVLFALSRERIVLVGADDEEAMARVLDLAEELYDAGGPLVSAHPVVLADGAWARFPWLERFSDLALRIERVLRLFSVRAYEAQAIALQRDDVRFAEPKVHVREDGVTLTFAAWSKGTATLLPVVDNVMIADGGAISVATLQQFLDAAGKAVVRTGLSPVRYFVPGEPPRSTSHP